MNQRLTTILIAAACAVVGAICLVWWFAYSAGRGFDARLERSLPELPAASPLLSPAEAVNIEGELLAGDGQPSAIEAAWPRFRGTNFDNIAWDSVPLAETWGPDGPPALWSVPLGDGYAGPAVMLGRVYVLDYDEEKEGDALRCLSLDDGREIWRRWYKVRVKRNHGMSRTVPAVTEQFVVTIGPRCHVLCVDAKTGYFRWGLDLASDFGAKVPMWYTAQCPLIDGDVVVLAPGGSALLMGVDVRTGQVLWRTPNPHGWVMSHASVTPMSFAGRRMYVYAAVGGMAGVAADGAERGAILWETAEWNHAVVAPTPVPLPDGRIFVTAGYGVGSRMFQLVETNGTLAVKSLYTLDRKVFACEQHTPVFYRDRLFTVLPSDAGAFKQQLVCLALDGTVQWRSGEEHRYGLGPFMVADDKLLVLGDDGVLSILKASPAEFALLAQAKVVSPKESWAPMALADGRLLVRDNEHMVCLDLRRR